MNGMPGPPPPPIAGKQPPPPPPGLQTVEDHTGMSIYNFFTGHFLQVSSDMFEYFYQFNRRWRQRSCTLLLRSLIFTFEKLRQKTGFYKELKHDIRWLPTPTQHDAWLPVRLRCGAHARCYQRCVHMHCKSIVLV